MPKRPFWAFAKKPILDIANRALLGIPNMELRRVLKFNGTLGLTLPNKFTRVLDLHWQEYVEVTLENDDTIVVRKHKILKRRELDNGYKRYPTSAFA